MSTVVPAITGSGPVDQNTDLSEDLKILEGDDSDDVKTPASEDDSVDKDAAAIEAELNEDEDESSADDLDESAEDSEQKTIEEELAKTEQEQEEAEIEPAIGRPSFKEIVKEFPELAKKFPAIREIYFREDAFSKIYATVEEAREAAEKSHAMDFWDGKLAHDGDPSELVKSLPDEAIGNIADRILPSLAARNPQLYLRATAPVVKRMLVATARDAKSAGNENLYNSVIHLHNYLFDNPDLNSPLNIGARADDPETARKREELDKRIRAADAEKLDSFNTSVDSTTKRIIVNDMLKTFDPKQVLSQRVRMSLIRDVTEEVDRMIASDKGIQTKIASLRQRAASSGFSNEYKTRIISAYLGAFRALVGPVRQRVRAEALGKLSNQTTGSGSTRRFVPAEKPGSESRTRQVVTDGRNVNPKDVDWTKTSDEEFLAGKVTLKKKR